MQKTKKTRAKVSPKYLWLALCLCAVVAACLLLGGQKKSGDEANIPAAEASDQTVTVAAVGDISISKLQLAAVKTSNGYDFSPVFSAVSGLTANADLTVGDLELNFCGEPYGENSRAPQELAEELKNIGFDLVQTANTDSLQNGLHGLESTLETLDEVGLIHVGTYADSTSREQSCGVQLMQVGEMKIAFFAATKGFGGCSLPDGADWAADTLYVDYATDYTQLNKDRLLSQVEAAKAMEPDAIIALLHWGSEGESEISEAQEELADFLFQNGVDAIIGSHSHLVGQMQTRHVTRTDGTEKDCFVAYSLGNFYSDMTEQSLSGCQTSALLKLTFTKSGTTGETALTGISYTPLYLLAGKEAEGGYEILPIRSALRSGLFEDETEAFTAAIANLRTATASDFDSGE